MRDEQREVSLRPTSMRITHEAYKKIILVTLNYTHLGEQG